MVNIRTKKVPWILDVFQGGFVVPGAPRTCLSVTSKVSVRRIHLIEILPDVFFEQNTEGNFVKFW